MPTPDVKTGNVTAQRKTGTLFPCCAGCAALLVVPLLILAIVFGVVLGDDESSVGCINYAQGSLTGAEDLLVYPANCDDAAIAKAVNDYINKYGPGSPLAGKGEAMVAAAKHAGISPFLMTAQARKESQFGADPKSAPQYFNPFGTTGHGPNNQRHGRFTTYTSWEQAMSDYATNYIRRYIAVEGDKTLRDVVMRYAPPSENDTNLYVQEVASWLSEMYGMAKCTPTTDGAEQASDILD